MRVVIVDDHPVVRDGLRGMLEGDDELAVVGEAADGEEALRLVARVLPDVVLMDLRMPGLDGVAATARLTTEHPGVAVLVLTTYDGEARTRPGASCAGPSGPRRRERRCWRRRWPPVSCTRPAGPRARP